MKLRMDRYSSYAFNRTMFKRIGKDVDAKRSAAMVERGGSVCLARLNTCPQFDANAVFLFDEEVKS